MILPCKIGLILSLTCSHLSTIGRDADVYANSLTIAHGIMPLEWWTLLRLKSSHRSVLGEDAGFSPYNLMNYAIGVMDLFLGKINTQGVLCRYDTYRIKFYTNLLMVLLALAILDPMVRVHYIISASCYTDIEVGCWRGDSLRVTTLSRNKAVTRREGWTITPSLNPIV